MHCPRVHERRRIPPAALQEGHVLGPATLGNKPEPKLDLARVMGSGKLLNCSRIYRSIQAQVDELQVGGNVGEFHPEFTVISFIFPASSPEPRHRTSQTSPIRLPSSVHGHGPCETLNPIVREGPHPGGPPLLYHP
jgi:hypothetical protein